MSASRDEEIADLLAFDATPPPLGSALETELSNLAPVATRRPHRQLAIVLVATGLVITTLLVVLGVRADLRQLPTGWMPGVALAWTAGIVAAGWFALIPRRGSMMPRWRLALAAVVATSSTFILLGLLVHPSGPSSIHYGWERFGHGHPCLKLGLATALVPVLVGAWFARGIAPVRSRWIAAALGALGGSAGGLLLHLYCRIADGPHIGLIHGGVVICAVLIASVLLPRITSTRP